VETWAQWLDTAPTYNCSMPSVTGDLRFGARMLAKNPGFTLTAIAVLALGIGANVAIFTVASALLLRPLPYQDPQRLVSLAVKDKTTDFGGTLLRYEMLRCRNRSFQAIAAWTDDNLNFTGRSEPQQVPVARVTSNFFSTLGVQPQLGRAFTQVEGTPEAAPVAIISDSLWRSHFGGNANLAGQTVTLDGVAYAVVGVLPAGIQFPFVTQTDIWLPRYFELSLMTPQRLRMGVGYLNYLARLKPGVSLGGAAAELGVLNDQYRKQNPAMPDADPGIVTTVAPLSDLVVENVRTKVLVLSFAVALVLLIACANVASLLLSRALARRREIAVRIALGASRVAVVRQLLTESLLMALIAGALGIGLGWTATRALVRWGATQLPQGIPIGIDLRVLLFTLGISLLTGIIFGAAPAWLLSWVDPNSALRAEGRGTAGGRARARLGSLLVVGQVGISLLLLVGAGLLLQSFTQLLRVDPGFDAGNVLTMNVTLPSVKYAKPQQQTAFFDALLQRVSALPGVRSAAISAAMPLETKRITPMLPEGQPDAPLSERPFIDIQAVSPQWFKTMRIPLRAGREFGAADNADSQKVVIVNESFARRFWPGQNPLGKGVTIGRWPQPAQVVGVSADVRNKGLAQDAEAQLYIPFAQLPWTNMNLIVRTAVSPESLTSAVRAQVYALDPDQPVTNIQTVDELVGKSRTQPRFTLVLLGAFSATALALALMGIYGLLAYSVAVRRQEMGIRLALGAHRADILLLIVRKGVQLTVAGVTLGLAAAFMLTRLMASMLYRVGTHDLATFALSPLVFLGVALLACYLPARCATKVDPAQALREA
jgi:putative ABC transport system permease protein